MEIGINQVFLKVFVMAREGFIKYQTPELLYFDPLQISNSILKAELRRASKQ